jgi:L-threonylcarbamoyladenylate synthase
LNESVAVLGVDASDVPGTRRAVEAAAAALRGGMAVVLPTDTVYGIAARPDDPVATGRLFEAKRRPRELNLAVLAATPKEALALGTPSRQADALAAAFWPGPLTVVLPRSDRCVGWMLGRDRGTIGLRVPNHPVALAVLEEAGPLAVTSANRSGQPPAFGAEELLAALGETVAVYLVEAHPSPSTGRPPLASTVVDLTGPRPRRTRRGPVDDAHIDEVVRRSGVKGETVDFGP